jgi:Fe-S cluster assembly protein SufB
MLAELDYDDIRYFVRASETPSRSWDDVPEDVKKTFDRLGIPEAERKFLSGVGAQYESEVVYHQIHEDLEKQGVIFTDMDTALREHEDLVRQYFATVIPPNDNKLAALNSAVWSGVRPRRCPRRNAVAGVLPDQHREHGTVRAHADHC